VRERMKFKDKIKLPFYKSKIANKNLIFLKQYSAGLNFDNVHLF